MTEPLVLSALIDRRARTDGMIRELESRIRVLRVELTHIDATIRIFSREAVPDEIEPIRPVNRSGYFRPSELSKRCLDEIRKAAGQPMAIREIADAIMAAKGFQGGDKVLRGIIVSRLRPVLRRYWERGLIVKTGGRGKALWALVQERETE